MSIQSQTVQEVVRKATNLLLEKNISEPKLSAELLFCHALSCKRIDLYLNFDKPVREKELETFRGYIRRRLKHEPVQYIIGETEFFGLKFSVNASVLIPRPETEILVEQVIHYLTKNQQISNLLDIGTGSGIIPVSILSQSKDSTADAIDISPEAIDVARSNAAKHHLENQIHFSVLDIFSEEIFSLNKQYDLIVSNPPYVSENDITSLQPEIRDYEPMNSLSDFNNGLRFYKRIGEISRHVLKGDGIICVEIGFDQQKSVSEIFSDYGLEDIRTYKDYSGIDRVILARRKVP